MGNTMWIAVGNFSAERGLGALALADLSLQTRVLKHGFDRRRLVVLNSPAWSDQKGKKRRMNRRKRLKWPLRRR
jgi:hypothetical protein